MENINTSEEERNAMGALMANKAGEGGGVPESAGGYSESCPVFRCRQTGWELWSLAWSMLQQKETSVYMLLYIHTYHAHVGLLIPDIYLNIITPTTGAFNRISGSN